LTKQLWLSLIETLAYRGVVDLPPQAVLDGFTVAQIIAEVQRAVVGPTTWLPRSSSPPTPSWQRSAATPPDFDSSTLRGLRLLPGGRHILLEQQTCLQFWEISSGEIVWTRQINFPYRSVVELTDGGLSACVLIYRSSTTYVPLVPTNIILS
jgi:hypothetical protein